MQGRRLRDVWSVDSTARDTGAVIATVLAVFDMLSLYRKHSETHSACSQTSTKVVQTAFYRALVPRQVVCPSVCPSVTLRYRGPSGNNFPCPHSNSSENLGCSLWSRSVMLGSAERGKVRLITVKLFSKNSNLYDHDTSTLQTDGRTTCHGNTA